MLTQDDIVDPQPGLQAVEQRHSIYMLHDQIVAGISHILERNAHEAGSVDQPFNSTEKRLARVLLLLANFAAAGTDHRKDQPGDVG